MAKTINEFVKIFMKEDRYSPNSLYNDFLLDCMASIGHKLQTPWSERKRELLFKIGQEYGELVIESPPLTDLLGPVHMELSSKMSKDRLGQFFTPQSLGKMMARLSIDESAFEKAIKEKSLVPLHEPSVGSGSTVMAFVDELHQRNAEYVKHLTVSVIDVDPSCCREFCIQMFMNAYHHQIQPNQVHVWVGNTLGPLDELDYFWGYSTKAEEAEDQKEDSSLLELAKAG